MTNDTDHPTPKDTGKPVVDTEGNRLGIITAVEGDTVEVDPDSDVDITENLRALFSGSPNETDTYSLSRDALHRDRYADLAVFRVDPGMHSAIRSCPRGSSCLLSRRT